MIDESNELINFPTPKANYVTTSETQAQLRQMLIPLQFATWKEHLETAMRRYQEGFRGTSKIDWDFAPPLKGRNNPRELEFVIDLGTEEGAQKLFHELSLVRRYEKDTQHGMEEFTNHRVKLLQVR